MPTYLGFFSNTTCSSLIVPNNPYRNCCCGSKTTLSGDRCSIRWKTDPTVLVVALKYRGLKDEEGEYTQNIIKSRDREGQINEPSLGFWQIWGSCIENVPMQMMQEVEITGECLRNCCTEYRDFALTIQTYLVPEDIFTPGSRPDDHSTFCQVFNGSWLVKNCALDEVLYHDSTDYSNWDYPTQGVPPGFISQSNSDWVFLRKVTHATLQTTYGPIIQERMAVLTIAYSPIYGHNRQTYIGSLDFTIYGMSYGRITAINTGGMTIANGCKQNLLVKREFIRYNCNPPQSNCNDYTIATTPFYNLIMEPI